MLEDAIKDYLCWMIENGYAQTTFIHYERVLRHFCIFIESKQIRWEVSFAYENYEAFKKQVRVKRVYDAIRGLSLFLFQKHRIKRPLEDPIKPLPQHYEEYLTYYNQTRQPNRSHILRARNTLSALHDFLTFHNINLNRINIKNADNFLAERTAKYCVSSAQAQRSYVRGFLRYLYQMCGVLRRDLSKLIVGTPQFAQAIPPKFLTSEQMKKLFEAQNPSTPLELRGYAALHIAASLGLRPKEISLITLDDISFENGVITLPDRKSCNPVRLPIPESTIKAISAYIIGGRPKSGKRRIFICHRAPFKALSARRVGADIQKCISKAGLRATPYHLRHTYAQKLLESGVSVYDIKQMLGHDRIRTTQFYLNIHTELMREVLIDETL